MERSSCCAHHGSKKGPRVAALAPARLATIGVNSYLWQASLETLKFMPLATVDSNGGVIVTDWYSNPQSPNERIKVTVTEVFLEAFGVLQINADDVYHAVGLRVLRAVIHPQTGEVKRRTIALVKAHDVSVEIARGSDIKRAYAEVIEFADGHVRFRVK